MRNPIEGIYNKRYYEQNLDSIQAKRLESQALVQRCFKYIHHSLIPFNRILDLGCGTGTRTYWLKDYAQNVIAVDISKVGITKAKCVNNHEKITYSISDVNSMNLDSQSDCITSFGLSTTNLDDIEDIAQTILKYINRYGCSETLYLHYSKTDFSGENPGWKYHTSKDLTILSHFIKSQRAIQDCKIVFFLPHGFDLEYTNPLNRWILKCIANLYYLARRVYYRFAYIVIIWVKN